jgi:hypothetical protein
MEKDGAMNRKQQLTGKGGTSCLVSEDHLEHFLAHLVHSRSPLLFGSSLSFPSGHIERQVLRCPLSRIENETNTMHAAP